MKYHHLFFILVAFALLIPQITLAQSPPPATFATVVAKIKPIANTTASVLISVAVFILIAGLLRYITAGDDMEKVKKGRDFIVYGLLGIFIMISVWGIVYIFIGSFRLPTNLPVPK